MSEEHLATPATAREALAAWWAETKQSPWQRSPLAKLALGLHEPDSLARREAEYADFAATVGGPLDDAARLTNRDENLPVLDAWDGIGQRTEGVRFHPDYHQIGQAAYASGIIADYAEPGREVGQLVKFFLLAHLGEGGHCCPLACTAGLVKVLQQKGSDLLKTRYLPGLLRRDGQHLVGAQFVTEVQGGSDVGQGAVRARPQGDCPEGSYRLRGEKWFCSVINADLFLLTARVEDGPRGTAGLGCFLVPRRLPDGSLNHFRIRRLKTKLGTRSMASAEVDWLDAHAWPVGPVDEGFKTMVSVVLQTSRVVNAVGTTGSMARAMLDATAYARHRVAFGNPVAVYPSARRILAKMATETWACHFSTFHLAALSARLDRGEGDDADRAALRMWTNANKYWTSIRNTQTVRDAMEILGGNGAIEDFSVLPRLFRDSMVFESWEGTHNTLGAQVLRDVVKLGLHEPMFDHLGRLLEGLPAGPLRDQVGECASRARDAFLDIREVELQEASARVRDSMDLAMVAFQAATLLEVAEHEFQTLGTTRAPAAAGHLLDLYPPARLVGPGRASVDALLDQHLPG